VLLHDNAADVANNVNKADIAIAATKKRSWHLHNEPGYHDSTRKAW